jgi:hypothetical protein
MVATILFMKGCCIMKQFSRDFRIIPSVVPADQESTITMHPQGENARFIPGKTYTVSIREVEHACAYYDAFPAAVYQCTANEDGSLSFTHFFKGEQKHTVSVQRPEDERHGIHYAINHRVRYDSDMTYQFYLYSLAPDLYGCRTLRGDLHCHTWESDGRQDAARTVGNYRAWGHDFLAITDHYVHFAAEKAMKLFADAPLDMTLLFGEEVHLPTERIHAVHVGGRESINADWRTRPEEIRAEVAKIMEDLTVDEGVHPEDYAWRIWIARRAKDFGGISMLAHPQWVWNYTYFMADVTTEQLLREGIHDALELNSATGIDSTVAMWADLRAQGVHIPLVGVSDGHNNDTANGMPGAIHTIVVAKDRSFASIADAIHKEHSVAVDCSSGRPRVYGTARMVKFVQFALDAFYPMYEELCRPQGMLLSEWSLHGGQDEACVSLLRAHNERSEAFAKSFFGI